MLATRVLAPHGALVVQSGSPYFAPEAFWGNADTITAAGYRTLPYQVDVPSFGNWGFVLARHDGAAPVLRLAPGVPRRFLDAPTLAASTTFPADRARSRYRVRPSTLDHPRILDYTRRGWKTY
ncbi:MAG: hypothetical protein PGN13_07935 [Patulibacter minatonensis]